MLVCAIPQQTNVTVSGRPRRKTPSSWRRWAPREPLGTARGVAPSAVSSSDKFLSWRRKGRRHLSLTGAQRSHKPEKHAFADGEKMLDEKKSTSEGVKPLLDDDDASTLWSADEPSPKRMGNTRCRIRRFLSLHRHRRREASEDVADAEQVSRSRKSQKTTREEELRDLAEKADDGSTLGWSYNLALGLAWYLPAPFDMMPQGYPSRVF
ncbi:hypothetical protein CPLU01_11088 [Colletotrichum plurivorum]|uniref:Uncharacterized protein n=1 Tax=Colletotrichum plurivorum TaxID=2175906 RepID=A0A8H6K3E9_9PEZI|nr:hypothetical protein CPLU01_11088 [Colletotrichum plurivorum]